MLLVDTPSQLRTGSHHPQPTVPYFASPPAFMRHLLPLPRVGCAVIAGLLLGLVFSGSEAVAQGRIEQAPDSVRDSTAVRAVPSDSMQQQLDAATEAIMTALDSLAAQSADSLQAPSASPDPRPSTITIDGLVLNETRTRMGTNFFDIFYSRWTPPENARNFTITVKEQPMPSLGTRVVVNLNGQPVFQTRLQPRYEYIEQAALRAVQITWRRLQRGQARQRIY